MFFFISKIELKLKETEKEEIVKEVLKIRNNRILEALKKSKGVKL
jgi:UDP-N-acetylenolpyruvoylglucosamine reductase